MPQELTAGLDADLAALTGPLRKREEMIEAEIQQHESALAELREARTKVRKTLAFLDPSNVASRRRRGPDDAVTSTPKVSPETLDRIEGWLRAHEEVSSNGGFSAPSLLNEHGFDLTSRATLTNALNQLHSAGVIRLDHRGQGGTKFFRVVA